MPGKKYTDIHTRICIHTYTHIWSKISKMLIIVEHGSSLYYSILFMFENFCNKKGRKKEGKEREGGREGSRFEPNQ